MRAVAIARVAEPSGSLEDVREWGLDREDLAFGATVPHAGDRLSLEREFVTDDGSDVVRHEPLGEQLRIGQRAPHFLRRVG